MKFFGFVCGIFLCLITYVAVEHVRYFGAELLYNELLLTFKLLLNLCDVDPWIDSTKLGCNKKLKMG